MIFVTVGTQLAFDRLVEVVDGWAATAPEREIFAQIGPGAYVPRNVEFRDYISPQEHTRLMTEADIVVGHAGMGTIIRALELGKSVLVMPRQASLGEHRNDHQLATAQRFSELGRVGVFNSATELQVALSEASAGAERGRIEPYASSRLIGALSAFINA